MIGATSRPDLLDAALLRPGRLDRLVYCGFPTAAERLEILRAAARRLALADGVDFEELAERTDGYTGKPREMSSAAAVVYGSMLTLTVSLVAKLMPYNMIHKLSLACSSCLIPRAEVRLPSRSTASCFCRMCAWLCAHERELHCGMTLSAPTASAGADLSALLSEAQLAAVHEVLDAQPAAGSHGSEQGAEAALVVTVAHLRAALSRARPSISAQEATRLEATYRQFRDSRDPFASPNKGGKRATLA